jgi:hypothetical protein
LRDFPEQFRASGVRIGDHGTPGVGSGECSHIVVVDRQITCLSISPHLPTGQATDRVEEFVEREPVLVEFLPVP